MSELIISIDLHKNNIFDKFDLFEMLIKNKIITEETKINEKSILEYVISNNRIHTLRLLCDNNFDINKSNNDKTPLYYASSKGYLRPIEILIEKKAEVNFKRKGNGSTPLYIAVQNNHFKVSKLLLEHKSNPNNELKDGATPLLIAIQDNNLKMVKLLFEYKVDLNKITELGCSPLYMAVQYDYIDIVEYLLNNGVSIKNDVSGNSFNSSVLNIGVIENNYKTVKILIDANTDVNEVLYDKKNNLMMSIEKQSNECSELLIKSKIDVNHKDKRNRTPLDYALIRCNEKIVKLLLDSNADPDYVKKKINLPKIYCEMLDEAKEKKKENKIKNMEQDNCPICLEPFDLNKKEEIFITSCYHFYHKECWGEYGKKECPICRKITE